MTTADLQKLTPEEKRAMIAKTHAGWIKGIHAGDWWLPGDNYVHAESEVPRYVDDLNAALTLIDFLAGQGWRCNLGNGLDKTWECEFMRPPTAATRPEDIAEYHGETLEVRYGPADTLAEAICDGFLLAAVPDPAPAKTSAVLG